MNTLTSPPREFRAAWIASVWNIDWPSAPGLPVSKIKEEFQTLLNTAYRAKLNALVLQIRPEGDALYNSNLEPWSYWLTGRQGTPPSSVFDPLQYAIEEAHAKGMELHAWFNPFRAQSSKSLYVASNHVIKKHPSYIMNADNYVWMNPGLQQVQDYSLSVFEDVLRRYDVDGIHIDDYFYPYPKNGNYTYDDSATYRQYVAQGGTLDLLSWRRANINRFVQSLYALIKRVKPYVKFGISPFGIYRPGIPAGIEAGIDSYVHLATDTRLWWREGWVDYFSPQLYWRIDQTEQSFRSLINWWASENLEERHLWVGIASSRILGTGSDANRRAEETLNQLDLTRQLGRNRFGTGAIHWSMESLLNNRDSLVDKLARTTYSEWAIVPASPWLALEAGEQVKQTPLIKFSIDAEKAYVSILKSSAAVRWWLVQRRNKNENSWSSDPLVFADKKSLKIAKTNQESLVLRAVFNDGSLSENLLVNR